jgi:putative membrane protein
MPRMRPRRSPLPAKRIPPVNEIVPLLPHVNAGLNTLATVLLLAGYALIRRRQERLHMWAMLACFAVSAIFLASYLTYHFNIPGGSKKFPLEPPPLVRYSYYLILLTHVVLAAAVPFLAVATIWLGLADRRAWHVRLARWTFPIWLYVSVTGVVVYLMLYQLYPPPLP